MVERIRVVVGIPSRNRAESLERCLDCVFKQTFFTKYQPDVIVVNDGDKPLKSDFLGRIVVIRGKRSGPQVGHNIVLRNSPFAKYILRLDDDVELYPDFLEQLVSFLEGHQDVAAVGGVFPQPKDIDRLISQSERSHRQFYRWDTDEPEEVEHLYSSFLYRRADALEIGGFCELYSQVGHREETDFTLRLKHLLNKKLFVAPSAIGIHNRCETGGVRLPNYNELAQVDNLIFLVRMTELGISTKEWE